MGILHKNSALIFTCDVQKDAIFSCNPLVFKI